MNDSDADLVERLKARDTAAFDVVYDRFNTRLFTFLLRLSRDRDRAQDLLEDTWLRLVSHADRLRPEDRKSTRLNSSHSQISYAVFCLKKKKIKCRRHPPAAARRRPVFR